MSHFKDAASQKVYFSVTRDGKPIKMQRTIFTEVFYCMAMAGLFKVTKESKYKVSHEYCLALHTNIAYFGSILRPIFFTFSTYEYFLL